MRNGIEQRNEQIARELLKNGSDIEFVSSVTNLSVEKLEEICKKIEEEKKIADWSAIFSSFFEISIHL